mgnify:CR=1 FL=1
MRIIGGKFKGISLFGPKNKKIRPLRDMVRESIFNFLMHSNKISFQFERSNVLDLYSGTGSFGLECLSRKAKKVIFVEKEKEALNLLEKNIVKLETQDRTKIVSDNVFETIKKNNKYFLDLPSSSKIDLIFCDPPFKNENISELLQLIFKMNILNTNGIIILHRHKNTKEKMSSNFEIIDQRTYGLSNIIFGRFLSTST